MDVTDDRLVLEPEVTEPRSRATNPAVYAPEEPPPERTLIDILDATVAKHPHAAAIDDGQPGRVLPPAASKRSTPASASSRRRPSVVGDRVGIRIDSGTADLYVAILAVLRVGAAYVPGRRRRSRTNAPNSSSVRPRSASCSATASR